MGALRVFMPNYRVEMVKRLNPQLGDGLAQFGPQPGRCAMGINKHRDERLRHAEAGATPIAAQLLDPFDPHPRHPCFRNSEERRKNLDVAPVAWRMRADKRARLGEIGLGA